MKRQEMTKNEVKALEICEEEAKKLKLPMKLVDAKYVAAERTIIFRFAADNRVDFRELVKNVKAKLHIKVELHQVGPRDNAMQMGGIPHCGKEELCCKQFGRYPKITDEMLEAQGIKHSPKMYGYCGRIKCCYAYEIFADGTLTENRPCPCAGQECAQKSPTMSQAPKRYIYLVRHPQTTVLKADPTVFADGQTDAELSDEGLEQSERIFEYLKKENVTRIFSSPLKRATELATFLKEQLNLPLELKDELREINIGVWRGLPEKEVKETYPKLWEAWINKPEITRIPEGEPLSDVQRRASRSISQAINNNRGNLVFVTHKITILTYLLHLSGLPIKEIWAYLDQNPINLGQITKIELPLNEVVDRIETFDTGEENED